MVCPRAILLDFYGTVVEEDDVLVSAISEEIAGAAAGNPTPAEVSSYWGRRFRELCEASNGPDFRLEAVVERCALEAVLQHFGVDFNADALCDRLFAHWRNPPIFPEVKAVLAEIARPICLVSNVDNAALEAALAFNNLAFEHIVTSEDCRAYKPHPAPFRRALEVLGVGPTEALHVGDGLTADVQGAQALGVPVAWVNRTGRALRSRMKEPDFTMADLRGMADVLEGSA